MEKQKPSLRAQGVSAGRQERVVERRLVPAWVNLTGDARFGQDFVQSARKVRSPLAEIA